MNAMARVAGVTCPLFSIRTARDWGIGEIGDLPAFGAWALLWGQKLVQVLPPHELADGETSPYGARTAFGLDPIYLSMDAIEDLDPAAIERALGSSGQDALQKARASQRVDYAAVRRLKDKALHVAFETFRERHWRNDTPRARALRAFIETERAWLDDLALYVAIRESEDKRGWMTWPAALRDRDPAALESARDRFRDRILAYQYAQWLAFQAWDEARTALRKMGVELMGDLPFIVGSESADVWAHAHEFRLDVSLGAPPDAFSSEGQDWGLPAYNWEHMRRTGFAWLRHRIRHAARLYDRFRLDHLVGFFRMWIRQHGRGSFLPEHVGEQRALGHELLSVMKEEAPGSRIIGEDLGVIPPWVRETMSTLDVPGYRVLPWERDDGRFRDARHFPANSVATWSTHDTSPIHAWWHELRDDERSSLANVYALPFELHTPEGHLAVLRALFEAGSDLTLVQVQELLAAPDRINVPGTVGPHNWAYRMHQNLNDMQHTSALTQRAHAVRELVQRTGRA